MFAKSHKNIALITAVLVIVFLFVLALSACTMDSVMRIIVTIDTPKDGATVTSSPVTVSGTVTKHVNIKVNNIALPAGDKFSTSVALNEGPNTITVVAISDNPPETVTKSITVTYTPAK